MNGKDSLSPVWVGECGLSNRTTIGRNRSKTSSPALSQNDNAH